MTLLNLIEIVQAVEATTRIPTDTPAVITYFSKKDDWIFTAVFDSKVCDDCLQYEHETFTGDMLRSLFPYLEIKDLETIMVNAHPGCRCRLERILFMGDVGNEETSKPNS